MGCFLACFGLKKKKKKKPQKPSKNGSSGEQNQLRYVPLDSDISTKLDIKENITSDSYQLKEKAKEPAGILKTRKKVRFNLNVKAYEPIPDNDDDISMYLSDGEEETKWEFDTETKMTASLHYEDDNAIASSIIRSNYRYENCRDSHDEEDNELYYDEIEDSDEELDDDDEIASQEDFPWEFVKSDNEAKNRSCSQDLLDSQKPNARDRSQYVFSVLNPVENLSQWKAVKANVAATQQLLKCQKENLSTGPCSDPSLAFMKMKNTSDSCHPQGDTIAVDGSLSNWLSLLKT